MTIDDEVKLLREIVRELAFAERAIRPSTGWTHFSPASTPTNESRGETMRKAKEGDPVRAILDYFKREGILAWRNQSGVIPATYKGKTRWIHMGTPGVPDIVAVLPGQTWFIEVKMPGKKQSPQQRWFEECCGLLGHLYSVVDDLDDVVRRIEEYKLLAGFAWRRIPDPPPRPKRRAKKL